ncbi:biogenesis of lysosome-related organelles complex 1 subunit 4-like isoform X1 [Ostrea edulis]|uniref:biogenesis of lysosome-related organelles complex 1 subunit 4-like isoform X1 n=1 Tax=Ostrea edulis TaxID=37623 RepID=UPI0020965383|nr:biogenesis of lysosome-related organelles complex 1 subunit 4-like isoform X1 [Ostrea edulis]
MEETSITTASESSPVTQEETLYTVVEDLAADYVSYAKFDSAKEKEKFNENIEEMLAKLEEFCGMVDAIRADNNICLTETLPRIQKKCLQMQEIFERVDKLEAFVGVVKGNVAVLEECVNKAEDEMGSLSGLKKMLSSFVGPKKPVSKSDKKAVFEPPEIFSTKDYFPQPQGSNQTEEGGSAEK